MKKRNLVSILIADDDLEDCQMIQEAFQESPLHLETHFVHNGEELLSYLQTKWDSSQQNLSELPGLILLDLNMPKMDGREALAILKKHPQWHQIPVVVLTTSQAEEDIFRTYNLGANSFITKPVEYSALVKVMQELQHYWFETVELPNHRKESK